MVNQRIDSWPYRAEARSTPLSGYSGRRPARPEPTIVPPRSVLGGVLTMQHELRTALLVATLLGAVCFGAAVLAARFV